MAIVAQKYKDQHGRIKRNVEAAKKSWKENSERFKMCRDFLFKTALDMNDRGISDELQRPLLEVNVLETYISHLLGEFGAHTPSPNVQPVREDPQLANQAMVVEGHMRHIFECSKSVQLSIFRNILSGGYSILKIITDYVNEKSFDQAIYLKTLLDDTEAGFDPLAKEPHKGDGKFCYEQIPKTKEELEEEFPDLDLKDIDFSLPITNGFPWYYLQSDGDNQKKIVIVCSYFEKKNVYKTLYRVSDPSHPDNSITMTKDEYQKLLDVFSKSNLLIAPPVILEESRRKFTKIVHYQITGDQVLHYEETDFMYLPLVFIDGNSVVLKDGQMTRPYFFHAMDAQRMKNVCAQNIMNDVENMRQSDIFVAKEAIPQEPELRLAWLNPQKASAALAYNYFSETNDGATLPMPQNFPRQQISPAVIQMFQLADQNIQAVLGSFDAQQGLQNDMSGVAIQNGAMQSNNAAKPYINNYIIGMNQACKVITDLIPKYYTTLRTIPVINREGKRSYQVINDTIKNPIFKIEYEINDLEVEVRMDTNFEVQQSKFIQTVSQLMKISPILNQFFSTDGVPLILDNITMKDIAKVKEQFGIFMQKQQKMQQQQMQMQMQTNPSIVQQKIAEMKIQSDDKDRHVDLIKAFMEKKIEDRKADTEDAKAQADVLESQAKLAIAAMGAHAENKRSEVEMAIQADRHFNEKMQSDREHLLKTMELGAQLDLEEKKLQQQGSSNG